MQGAMGLTQGANIGMYAIDTVKSKIISFFVHTVFNGQNNMGFPSKIVIEQVKIASKNILKSYTRPTASIGHNDSETKNSNPNLHPSGKTV